MSSIINMGDLTPRYMQILKYFIDRIESGDFKEGDKLATEEEICNLFNVSRITVRQALSELSQRGYIVRKQGKGTFVRLVKTNMQLNSLQGFSEEMISKGLTPSTKLISVELCEPTMEIAEMLKVDLTLKMYSITRIRYANQVAMSLENVYVPFYLCPNIEQYDLTNSLYKIFSQHYNLSINRASQSIEAGLADKKVAKLLDVKPMSQSLIITRVTYLNDDIPFEYVKSVYRGDKYKFHVNLSKP